MDSIPSFACFVDFNIFFLSFKVSIWLEDPGWLLFGICHRMCSCFLRVLQFDSDDMFSCWQLLAICVLREWYHNHFILVQSECFERESWPCERTLLQHHQIAIRSERVEWFPFNIWLYILNHVFIWFYSISTRLFDDFNIITEFVVLVMFLWSLCVICVALIIIQTEMVESISIYNILDHSQTNLFNQHSFSLFLHF